MAHPLAPSRQHAGFSLIELLVVIVVLGIAAATLTVVSSRGAEMSARLIKQQQASALAEGLLDEIRAMPYTVCDPNDANAGTAINVSGCATLPEIIGPIMGPEPTETRLGATRFDNVNDYNGLNIPAGTLRDASNNLMTALLPTVANCQVQAAVSPMPALALPGVLVNDALRIVVTVTCPDLLMPVMAEAIRVRYAPHRFQF